LETPTVICPEEYRKTIIRHSQLSKAGVYVHTKYTDGIMKPERMGEILNHYLPEDDVEEKEDVCHDEKGYVIKRFNIPFGTQEALKNIIQNKKPSQRRYKHKI